MIHRARILIIDDDPSVSRLWGRIVEMDGYAPIFATNCMEGYEQLATFGRQIRLILLDLGLPEMDGFAFRELQHDALATADIPTVVVSGTAVSSHDRERLQANDVLTKPVSIETLRHCITTHVREPFESSAAA